MQHRPSLRCPAPTWGWSCRRGAGAAMGLKRPWGWLFSPCKDRVEHVPLEARSCQVPARGQPPLLSRWVNFISRFYKNIRGTARDFKLISVFLFQCYYFFSLFFFFSFLTQTPFTATFTSISYIFQDVLVWLSDDLSQDKVGLLISERYLVNRLRCSVIFKRKQMKCHRE